MTIFVVASFVITSVAASWLFGGALWSFDGALRSGDGSGMYGGEEFEEGGLVHHVDTFTG